MDFGAILAGLDAESGVTAFLAAGAIIATLGFGKWAVKKVASFFG